MKDIRWISVTQVRIFRSDDLPYGTIQTSPVARAIEQAFGFSQPSFFPPAPLTESVASAITYTNGFISFDGRACQLQQLTIEPRRIRIVVLGESEVAAAVFERLKAVIREYDPRENKPSLEPLLLAEETGTVIQLDFPLKRVFDSESLRRFSAELPNKIDSHGSRIEVAPSAVRFHVKFENLPEDLLANGVTLLEKDVRIEARAQTPADENMYFIVSPNSSTVHLELIRLIETVFAT